MNNLPNETSISNIQKQENYREQFTRLRRAMKESFYLEAVFVAYSIMEDRTESVLRHAGLWDSYLRHQRGHNPNIGSKIAYIQNEARDRASVLHRLFQDDLLDNVKEWKEERNRLIHALLKQNLSTDELYEIASQGETLARTLANRATALRRTIQRREKQ